MKLPEFLIVGAVKAGTTAYYQYLLQHPNIFLSSIKKESRFLTGLSFETDPDICQYISVVTNMDEYKVLFERATPNQVIGEVDPWYLYLYQRTIPRIKQYLSPSIKIIVSLRNPVERSYSNYYQIIRQGWRIAEFEQLIDNIRNDRTHYWYEKMCLDAGLYYASVKSYLDTFGAENVLVLLYDDFKANPAKTLQTICRHIEVDETFSFDTSYKANQGGVPRSRVIHKFLTQRTFLTQFLKLFMPLKFRRKWKYRLINRNIQKYPSLTLEMRNRLIQYYQKDVSKLQDLLQRDLTHWLQ